MMPIFTRDCYNANIILVRLETKIQIKINHKDKPEHRLWEVGIKDDSPFFVWLRLVAEYRQMAKDDRKDITLLRFGKNKTEKNKIEN